MGQECQYSMCYRQVFPGDHLGDGLVNIQSVYCQPANELATLALRVNLQAWVQEM